jgi:hypothetical protein
MRLLPLTWFRVDFKKVNLVISKITYLLPPITNQISTQEISKNTVKIISRVNKHIYTQAPITTHTCPGSRKWL